MRFKRPCRLCGKIFRPTGKASRLCPKCLRERKQLGQQRSKEAWQKSILAAKLKAEGDC